MDRIEKIIVGIIEFVKGCVLLVLLIIMAIAALMLGLLSLAGQLLFEFLEWMFTWCNHCGSHNLEKVGSEHYCRECHEKVD